MFGFITFLSFSRSLASMFNVSDYAKYISLNNQPCMTRPTLTDVNPDECNQGVSCHPSTVIETDLIEVVILLMIHLVEYMFQTKHLGVFNTITGINKLETK